VDVFVHLSALAIWVLGGECGKTLTMMMVLPGVSEVLKHNFLLHLWELNMLDLPRVVDSLSGL
jgi:hypothetical protein